MYSRENAEKNVADKRDGLGSRRPVHTSILRATQISRTQTHVYGRRLTIVQLIAGEMVCGAFAIICSAVEFGWPFESIWAKTLCAVDVA